MSFNKAQTYAGKLNGYTSAEQAPSDSSDYDNYIPSYRGEVKHGLSQRFIKTAKEAGALILIATVGTGGVIGGQALIGTHRAAPERAEFPVVPLKDRYDYKEAHQADSVATVTQEQLGQVTTAQPNQQP